MSDTTVPETIGRYPVQGEIAAGGFGTVYRASDPLLGRELAIKVLHPHMVRDLGLRARFLAEGRALAALRHPNLVQVYDAGEADGRVYLVMEYVPGRSLAEVLGDGPLAAPAVMGIVEQVAGALDTLNAAGLVHRDVKPANILFADDGRAVLLDLGIARRLQDAALTSSSVIFGTPGYLAPEQLRNDVPVGPATDVYQLGATAYALFTGRAPFEGDISTVMYAVAHEPPPDLSMVRPDLPPHILAAVARALAKRPENRPAGAGAFAAELAGEAPYGLRAQPSATTGRMTAPVRPPLEPPAAGVAGVRRGGIRWPVFAGGVGLLVLALGLLVVLRRETDGGGASATADPRAAPVAALQPTPAPAGTPPAAPTAAIAGATTPAALPSPAPSPAAGSASAQTRTATAATAPPSPSAPSGGPNPSDSLVGQQTRACNYGAEFVILVARAEWTKTVTGQTAPGNAMWIVAFLDVTNRVTNAEWLVTRPVQLRDGGGRQYNVREYPPDPVDLARVYGVKGAFTHFEPGITEQTVVTFQVPTDIGPLTLVGRRDFC